jgi:hypothetical protein
MESVEHGMGIFESKGLRIFGPKGNKVIGGVICIMRSFVTCNSRSL